MNKIIIINYWLLTKFRGARYATVKKSELIQVKTNQKKKKKTRAYQLKKVTQSAENQYPTHKFLEHVN